MLIGSPDGVITATSTQMPDDGVAAEAGELLRAEMPAICMKISRIGNSKPIPNASIM